MHIEIRNPDDLRKVRAGLKLYARNARAASGTIKGLGKEAAAQQLTDEAEDVEQRLIPLFDEQGTLPLGVDGGTAGDADDED
jgi:hypothetical protein